MTERDNFKLEPVTGEEFRVRWGYAEDNGDNQFAWAVQVHPNPRLAQVYQDADPRDLCKVTRWDDGYTGGPEDPFLLDQVDPLMTVFAPGIGLWSV